MGLGGGTSWQDRELPNAHIPRVGKLGSSLDAPAPGMGPDAPWNRDTASVPGPAGPALATGGGGRRRILTGTIMSEFVGGWRAIAGKSHSGQPRRSVISPAVNPS